MLFLVLLLLFTNLTKCSNLGSALFYKKLRQAECWSEGDIARLRVRKIFEKIIPHPVTPDKVNEDFVKYTLEYFQNALKEVEYDLDKHTALGLKEILADTIGAHMRSEILPTARFAYYAGYVPYKSVKNLHDLFNQIKIFLNTQGLGWKKPDNIPQSSNLTVEKIRIGSGSFFDPCISLITKRDSRSCIHLPPPKSDDDFRPSAVALPFKSRGLINLESPISENVILKYYTIASRCILSSSPEQCRHSDFVNFNNELWHWMKRDVAPRLIDEKLYSAYGGVLRVAAAVQSYGKGLSRRNLFDYKDAGVSKWHPWKALKESYVYINTDRTPHMYVALIFMIAVAICSLQICYNYMISKEDGCHCKKRGSRSSIRKDVAYAKVDSNIPAMLPSHQSAVYYSEQKRGKKSTSKTKTSSLGSIRTQKVYDLHENTEKLMAVIMSDNEVSSKASSANSKSSHRINDQNVIDVGQTGRSKSPPKIETPITQKKVHRKIPKTIAQAAMYSTSTATNSGLTYQRVQPTDSWSGTDSSTSVQSLSSFSSKSRCMKSRSSRDLAWARRVVSKNSLHGKSTSGTELDINSYTTPQSQR